MLDQHGAQAGCIGTGVPAADEFGIDRRFEHTRRFGPVIAAHDIGAANQQLAAYLDAGDLFQLRDRDGPVVRGRRVFDEPGAAGLLARWGMFRGPVQAAISGAIIAVALAFVAVPIRVWMFGGVTGSGTSISRALRSSRAMCKSLSISLPSRTEVTS